MQKYPRKVTMFDKQKNWEVMCFKNKEAEDTVVAGGHWNENPSHWKDAEKANEEAEKIKSDAKEADDKLVRELKEKADAEEEAKLEAKTDVENEFLCYKCDFIGKNKQSLDMHKRHTGH